MKKLLSILVFFLILTGCSDKNSYKKNECKNKYGYTVKSEAFNNCIKDDDHFFAYGITYWSNYKFKENREKENLLKSINKIKMNIDHETYKNISYSSFLDEYFEDPILMIPKEGKLIPDTKFHFLSEISVMSPDENDKEYSVWFGNMAGTGRFHNIDIENKIVGKDVFFLWVEMIPMYGVVHKVYGSFKRDTNSFMNEYIFYVEDIIFTETDIEIDKIIERMIFSYCKKNNKNIEIISQIYEQSLIADKN